MAEVDFSNARIEPYTTAQGVTAQNPTRNRYMSLNTGVLYSSSSGGEIASVTRSTLINEKKQLLILFQGAFTASGTEFYLIDSLAAWHVSNISFSSGDTYVFQINATLVCN